MANNIVEGLFGLTPSQVQQQQQAQIDAAAPQHHLNAPRRRCTVVAQDWLGLVLVCLAWRTRKWQQHSAHKHWRRAEI